MRRSLLLALLISSFAVASARAEVRLPAVISSHMVLQRESEAAIWGWADPGETVAVSASWSNGVPMTKADASGLWRIMLHTPVAGGPFTIDITGEVKGAKNAIHLDDVLVGEVWLCGGQSNMEWAFSYGGVKDGAAERAAADDPKVRLFDVPNVVAAAPANDCKAAWAACTPDTVNGFSCVGWFFARELRKALDVPIGLIGVNWGGTVAQAWVSKEALAPFPRFAGELAWVTEEATDPKSAEARRAKGMADWWAAIDAQDLGARNGWAAKSFDDASWSTATLPGFWRGELANFDGVVWYRKTIELPKELDTAAAKKELALTLGPIDDMDSLWFDGEKIGGTETHGHWTDPRDYRVPARLATAGRHVIALRVVDTGGEGGVGGAQDDLAIQIPGTAGPRVELSGDWKLRVSMAARDFPQLPQGAQAQQTQQLHANVASVLFNGMVAPILPFAIRGALWYQGESNRGFGAEYADLMPALIADWRARFERPDFPFYFVQIAPYDYQDKSGVLSGELRQAQLETLRVKNTGMVVTTDIGDARNIHPANKQEVGWRLSLWALAHTYDMDVSEVSGPLVASMQPEGGKVRVTFTHTTGGLVAKGGALTGFEVCGSDGKWVAATATIDGDSVLVASAAVKEPKEARFGFADVCANNLFNGAGLPASPFCRIAR